MSDLVVAIDARLVSGTNTGDSTYWTGLLGGFRQIDSDIQFVLISNTHRPQNIPDDPRFRWACVSARSQRWWSFISLPLAARRLGAKLVHTQYSMSPLVGKGGITTVHDVSFFIGPEWFRPRDRAILRLCVPAACRRAARVIAVSETCRNEIIRYIPAARGKAEVVYNACPDWIQRVEVGGAKRTVGERLGLEGPYLLTVGTRWPRKNMALAVEAANLLPRSLPHRLVVTGKPGWGEENLGARGLAVGYVDSDLLSALYSAASLYMAPSRHEGFGIPLLEAFRCGCPVLCSTGGALPEVAGPAAAIEPSWRAEDWAARAEGLLRDESKLAELRRLGFERELEFSWKDSARRTLGIYETVAREIDSR